jgi:O-antigen/teichoic acid export membrane protein
MTFLVNILITLGSSVGVTLLGLLTSVLVARTLEPTGRGLMVTILLWPQILVWAGGLSLGYSNIYYGAAEPHARRRLFGNSLWAALILGSITGVAALFLLPHFVPLNRTQHILLEISLVLLPIGMATDYAVSLLQGTSQFSHLSLVRVISPAVTAVCLLLCWVTHTLTVTSAVVAVWIGGWTSFVLVLHVLIKAGYFSLRLDKALLRQSFSFSSRIHIGSLAALANGRLDQLLMTALVAPRALGLYAIAVTFSELLRQFAIAVTTVLYPKVAAEATPEIRRETAIRTTRWMLLIGCVGAVCMFFIAPIIVPLLWGSHFSGSIRTLQVLLPGTVALSTGVTMAASLHGAGRPGVSTIAEVASLIVMVPLLYFLLPRMGIFGAGLASTCGYFTNFLVIACYFAQTFGINSLLEVRPTMKDWKYALSILMAVRRRFLPRSATVSA